MCTYPFTLRSGPGESAHQMRRRNEEMPDSTMQQSMIREPLQSADASLLQQHGMGSRRPHGGEDSGHVK